MALTSDDVNFLVYRYLQESGKGLHLATANNIGTDRTPEGYI